MRTLALGHADALLVAAFATATWGTAFMLSFMALAMLGAAVAPDLDTVIGITAPASKDGDRDNG